MGGAGRQHGSLDSISRSAEMRDVHYDSATPIVTAACAFPVALLFLIGKK